MSKMMQVPDGWEVKSFSSLATINMGQSPDSEFVNENQEGMAFLQGNAEFGDVNPQELYWVTVPKKIAKKDDILISVRAPVGDMNIADKEYCIGRGLSALTVKKINQKFGFYALFQERVQLDRLAQGSTFLAIGKNDFDKLLIKYPKEKKEQEKIAKILSTLDKAIESTSRLIEKEKNIKIALMQELLTNGIDQNGQIRSPKTHTYKPTELGLIPDEWEVKKIGEICKFKQGIQIPIEEQSFDYETGKYRFLRISDYTQQTEDKRYVSEIYKDYLITDTDVVMVRYGETAGFVGINLSGVLANNLFRIIPIKKIDNQFLYYYLNSLYDAFKDMREAGAMPAISFSSLSRVYFPLFNIEEQKQIAKILTTQDKKIQTEETNLVKLKELKKGFMNDLLIGKVRVSI